MKVLVHIHSYNSEDHIDRSIQAAQDQTYPEKNIILVDNASTDDTLQRSFPENVTVLQNKNNLGVDAAVRTGLEYALDHQYDWIWILDSDSLPESNALERLVKLHASFSPEERSNIGVLCCTQSLEPGNKIFQGRRLTPGGPRLPIIDPNLPYCECDGNNWSGCLFNLKAVARVGFPRHGQIGYWEDLAQDYGDTDFIFKIKQLGYKVLTHRLSIIHHSVGDVKHISLLGYHLESSNHSPVRRYLFFRGLIYFWFYIYPKLDGLKFLTWFSFRLSSTIIKIIILENNRWTKIRACIRGVWDGYSKNLHRNFVS